MIDPVTVARGLRGVAAAQLSPDGERIVFLLRHNDGDRDVNEPWCCAIDGSALRRLLPDLDDVHDLVLSPDGERVCAVSIREGRPTLWVGGIDGGVAQAVASVSAEAPGPIPGAGSIGDPAWSADGGRIAFVTPMLEPGLERPVYREATSIALVVRDHGFRADGTGISPLATGQVSIVDVATGTVTTLTLAGRELAAPAFSPDGSRLGAIANDPTTSYVRHLAVFDLAGGGTPALLGPERVGVRSFAWSPDGHRIAVVGAMDVHGSTEGRLAIADVATGELEPMTVAMPAEPDEVVWPEDDTLLVNADRGGYSSVVEVDLAAGTASTLTDADGWHTGLAFDRTATRIVQTRDTAVSTGELGLLDRDTGAWSIVFSASTDVTSAAGLAPPRIVRAASGPFRIEATVLRPSGVPDDLPLPTVFAMHGGPAWSWGGLFVADAFLLASSGFQVAMPNVRGSTGFGAAFQDAQRGDYGGGEFDDLLAVVDALCAEGSADPERLGIMGASHGGYQTAWAIARTDRFAAAVCACPVIDLASEWGTHDSGLDWGDLYHGGPPWERRAHYLERSPATWAHRARTPTLIVQGLDDQRCPPSQSEQLFAILRSVGCETELVLYPGVAHELAWIGMGPAVREDYLTRVLSWFETHLRG
jgi:dipeptidyl aminopeptidase/acylaminoacyl peptidase